MLVGRSSPFGGQTRTRVLIVLVLLAQSYARELARTLDASLNGVQVALRGLERDGLVAARPLGRTRVYTLNPRYFAREELERYLRRLAEAETTLQDRIAGLRRRPRRTGKPV
jgi:DNA-binding transcriptional ArsR family regulator